MSEKNRLSKKEVAVLHYLLFSRDNHIMKERTMEDPGPLGGSWKSPKCSSEINVKFLLLWEQLKIARHISHSRILF